MSKSWMTAMPAVAVAMPSSVIGGQCSHVTWAFVAAEVADEFVLANGNRDFRRLVGLLRLPHDALGKWGQIAQDVMHRTGLWPRGEEDGAVRWIAIRHCPDHVHLVAMLARQDRTRPRQSRPLRAR
jgi:hypothetical protein